MLSGIEAATQNAAIADAPELDCLRQRLAPAVLAATATRAHALGLGAHRVLIAHGLISEDDYFRALAAELGLAFEPLETIQRSDCPLDDARFIEAVAGGMLPLQTGAERIFVLAPQDIRRFIGAMRMQPSLRRQFRLTAPARIKNYVLRHASTALGEQATTTVSITRPDLSAAPGPHRGIVATLALVVAAATAVLTALPFDIAFAVNVLLAVLFVAWIVLRLTGVIAGLTLRGPRGALPADRGLPDYSIIVALYREARCVGRLIGALQQLDYPKERLDIKLVLERDDTETLAELQRIGLPPYIDVLIAPDIGPRTKPKALNLALPFVTGRFVVVYDAEDRPEPNQLRRALAAFRRAGPELACVQARLTIDNTADGWLAGFHTAEYAAQFDLILPTLAALRVPLPLGGTSNHFRTHHLRRAGAWDSYNVTEDADLGMRLARYGYQADMIASATYEEAPNRLGGWLRQRTRWFKGWMQTWLVHMRHPWRLLRDLGPFSFLAFQLVVGGNVLAALVHPFFLIGLIWTLVTHGPDLTEAQMLPFAFALFSITAAAGYLTSILLGCVGLLRQGLPSTLWVLLLTPWHWLLLSYAAWRALGQLVRAPYHWEKTEHGLARTSRVTPRGAANEPAPQR